MKDLRKLEISPYTYLSVAGVAFINVWWWKLNPITANITLAIGIICFSIFVFALPWLAKYPAFIRVVCALFAAISSSIFAYYTLWTPSVPISLLAITSMGAEQIEVKRDGAQLPESYTAVRIFIGNKTKKDFENIDLVITPDQPVSAVRQITNVGTTVLELNEMIVDGTGVNIIKNIRKPITFIFLASSLGFRLRCEKLPRGSKLVIDFAAVTIRNVYQSREEDKLLAFNFESGKSVWFAHREHSNAVFGKGPTVKNVLVSGIYMVDARQHEIKENIEVEDVIGDAISKIKNEAVRKVQDNR